MAKPPKSDKIKLAEAVAKAEQRALLAEAALANQLAVNAENAAKIAQLEWELAQMRRALYGPRKERRTQLLDQLALAYEDAEANAAQAEVIAEEASARAKVAPHERKRPARKPFPEHLPRERVELAPPASCACCGSEKLSRIGEDITETLEVIPRQWKVVQTVRPKMACRDCETIGQQPAPFHVTPRGWAGPNFLAMLLFEKYGTHQPLNRQRDRYAREGVDLSLSTLADQVGHAAAILRPLHELIKGQVLSAERIHADDTTVPVLAKHQTITGRVWTYVRDDKPFGGADPPAAWYCYSADRTGAHPRQHLASYCGILQSDAYAGYNGFFAADREAGAMTNGLCWAHARRKFFELAVLKPRRGKQSPPPSPLAREAVARIDALFDIEREINGSSHEERLARRQKDSAPLIANLKTWLEAQCAKLSDHDNFVKAANYLFNSWDGFAAFLDDGRICLTNNCAERALRGIALGRKSWMFVGSDQGGHRAAMMYTLIQTAKLNDVDPQAWLADALHQIAGISQTRLVELLPWNWKAAEDQAELPIAA